jgi:hypothetical protein
LNKECISSEAQELIFSFVKGLEQSKKKETSYYYHESENNSSQLVLNLGVPHGITGIILILTLIKEKNIHGLEIDKLILFFVDKIISYESVNTEFYFTTIIRSENEKTPSALAWCYGDLMAGYAIFKAGSMFNNTVYRDYGLKVLRKTTNRMDIYNDNLVLCHGFPSIICIYDELFSQTKDIVFFNASKKWKVIAYTEFKKEFNKYIKDNSVTNTFFNNTSLFYGFPGFILSLITEKSEIVDNWKKCLLL